MNFKTKMVEIAGVEISVMVRQRNDQGTTQSQPVETGSLNATGSRKIQLQFVYVVAATINRGQN